MEDLLLLPLLLLQQRIASSVAKTHPECVLFSVSTTTQVQDTTISCLGPCHRLLLAPFLHFYFPVSILCRAGREIILIILLSHTCAMAYEAPRA